MECSPEKILRNLKLRNLKSLNSNDKILRRAIHKEKELVYCHAFEFLNHILLISLNKLNCQTISMHRGSFYPLPEHWYMENSIACAKFYNKYIERQPSICALQES